MNKRIVAVMALVGLGLALFWGNPTAYAHSGWTSSRWPAQGMMYGMMHGGMGGSYGIAPDAEISVTADEAVDIAQRYLNNRLPGTIAATTVDAFPGYYTLHFLEDGEVTGMLSVNAYTGQVFFHTWHGEFITMLDEAH